MGAVSSSHVLSTGEPRMGFIGRAWVSKLGSFVPGFILREVIWLQCCGRLRNNGRYSGFHII